MVVAARAGPCRPVREGAQRRAGGAARRDDPASVLRPAELARDAALHPDPRSRSRRTARQGGRSVLMRVAIGLRLEGNENWGEAATDVTEAEGLGADTSSRRGAWGSG